MGKVDSVGNGVRRDITRLMYLRNAVQSVDMDEILLSSITKVLPFLCRLSLNSQKPNGTVRRSVVLTRTKSDSNCGRDEYKN